MRYLACAAALILIPCLAPAQETFVATPAGVKVEGMPPIPQSIADGLAQYASFRDAQMIAWHPTKRQILITTSFGEFPQLHLVDGPGHARTQLTFLPRPGVSRLLAGAFDPIDPDTFVFQRGQRTAQSLFRYDMKTGQVSLVADTKSRFAPVWSRQGKWLAYDSTARNGKDRDLYVMQPSDPKTARRVLEVEGSWAPQDWSPDGRSLLALELVSNFETYVWRIDVATGQKQALTPRDAEKAAWFDAQFSADGRKVYATSDRDGQFRIWQCDVATGKWTPVTPKTDRIDTTTDSSSFALSPDGSMMAVLVDRGSVNELRVFDAGTLKPRPLPSLPIGVVSRLSWRPASRELAFTLESIRSKGDVYSVDTSLGTLSRWTASETSFNPEGVLPPPQPVEWKSPDGVAFSGTIYRPSPKFKGRRPVWVSFHGGPDTRDRVHFMGRSNYFLNELGVAVIFPNVRGSEGFGRSFALLDNGTGRDGVIKDVGTVLDWIAGQPDLDKERVVLSGGSYGGWVALEAGIVYNDRIRGIVEGAGQTNFITYLEDTDVARQENRRREFGDERDPQMRKYLLSISPVTRAAELKKPTLIMHPGKDMSVPVSQAQEIVSALKANNATVWYAEFSDTTHESFPGSVAANDFMIDAWIMFVKTFVLNDAPRTTASR
jgi:dipeptidyl aminopeptidase/acylaminoacyl peptidase